MRGRSFDFAQDDLEGSMTPGRYERASEGLRSPPSVNLCLLWLSHPPEL